MKKSFETRKDIQRFVKELKEKGASDIIIWELRKTKEEFIYVVVWEE